MAELRRLDLVSPFGAEKASYTWPLQHHVSEPWTMIGSVYHLTLLSFFLPLLRIRIQNWTGPLRSSKLSGMLRLFTVLMIGF